MAAHWYTIEATGYSCILCVLWDSSIECHEVTDSCFLPDQRLDAQCSSFTPCAPNSSPFPRVENSFWKRLRQFLWKPSVAWDTPFLKEVSTGKSRRRRHACLCCFPQFRVSGLSELLQVFSDTSLKRTHTKLHSSPSCPRLLLFLGGRWWLFFCACWRQQNCQMAFQCFAKRQEPFITEVTWIPFICICRSGLKLLLTVQAKSTLHLPETQRAFCGILLP